MKRSSQKCPLCNGVGKRCRPRIFKVEPCACKRPKLVHCDNCDGTGYPSELDYGAIGKALAAALKPLGCVPMFGPMGGRVSK